MQTEFATPLDLPLARYRLDFTVETPLNLPAFAGSTLRGAFGGALRASACMTRQKTCDGCPLLSSRVLIYPGAKDGKGFGLVIIPFKLANQ